MHCNDYIINISSVIIFKWMVQSLIDGQDCFKWWYGDVPHVNA